SSLYPVLSHCPTESALTVYCPVLCGGLLLPARHTCPAPRSSCEPGEFTCAGGRCIPADWVCDNEDDCGDGSDEICPSTCAPNSSAAPALPGIPHRLVTMTKGCVCPPGEFQCPGDQCVPADQLCDGHKDYCVDGSDELGCAALCGRVRCPVLAGISVCLISSCVMGRPTAETLQMRCGQLWYVPQTESVV
uniref:Uncharacterized protein n=1 Tax=Neogobius melanostomus TaxID=47308 RepID=A0A8C6SYU3_9GOBI